MCGSGRQTTHLRRGGPHDRHHRPGLYRSLRRVCCRLLRATGRTDGARAPVYRQSGQDTVAFGQQLPAGATGIHETGCGQMSEPRRLCSALHFRHDRRAQGRHAKRAQRAGILRFPYPPFWHQQPQPLRLVRRIRFRCVPAGPVVCPYLRRRVIHPAGRDSL